MNTSYSAMLNIIGTSSAPESVPYNSGNSGNSVHSKLLAVLRNSVQYRFDSIPEIPYWNCLQTFGNNFSPYHNACGWGREAITGIGGN